jgi:hypothetical protein
MFIPFSLLFHGEPYHTSLQPVVMLAGWAMVAFGDYLLNRVVFQQAEEIERLRKRLEEQDDSAQ